LEAKKPVISMPKKFPMTLVHAGKSRIKLQRKNILKTVRQRPESYRTDETKQFIILFSVKRLSIGTNAWSSAFPCSYLIIISLLFFCKRGVMILNGYSYGYDDGNGS
jgi:hypothetical protein